MASQVVGSSFTNGTLFPNYVNGRLLAAEDLATEQTSLCQRDDWSAQAAGTGTVSGLWVTATGTSLTIGSGLGIPQSGEPVSLSSSVTLSLALSNTTAPITGATFTSCSTTVGGTQGPLSAGAYLLTALPASQLQGQAPMASQPGKTTPGGCTSQWQVEGVQFKAISLPVGSSVNGVTITTDNLRNLVAHWCLGTSQLINLGTDPFNLVPSYSGLNQLSSVDLTPADLPLCVIYWDGGNVTFVDNWSVRRRVTRPDVSNGNWSAVVADERGSDGEARFLQFQDQVQDIVTRGNTRSAQASDLFPLLPPVGFLPVALDQSASDIESLYQSYVNNSTPQSASAERPAGTPKVAEAEPAVSSTPKVAEAEPAMSPVAISSAAFYDPISILSPTVLGLLIGSLQVLPAQSGFVPSTFFSGLNVQFGGFITWDTAYFALRQSYFLEPLPTVGGPASSGTTSGQGASSANVARLRPRLAFSFPGTTSTIFSQPISTVTMAPSPVVLQAPVFTPTFPIVFRPPPIPISFPPVPPPPPPIVVLTYYYVTENFIAILNALNAAQGASAQAAVTPYLVFMKNQFWPPKTQAPFVTSAPPPASG
jgi:hypothetical protein